MPSKTTDNLALEVLTTEEVAERLHVKEGTLRYWRSIKTGPPWFRIGPRRVAYLHDDIERWWQAQVQQSYTDPADS
jgi:predicted DNA-binding transcriptional regulator AlpA